MYNFINTLINNPGNSNEYLAPYAPLIGDWDFDWIGEKEDGSRWEVPGQWHFAWILGGRAMQDNWICPRIDLKNNGTYPEGEYGTTIRFYDHKDECIKVVWVGSNLSNLNVFGVKLVDGRIIQHEINPKPDNISKWQFKDITNDSFTWEAFASNDEGQSWKLEQQVFAKRMQG